MQISPSQKTPSESETARADHEGPLAAPLNRAAANEKADGVGALSVRAIMSKAIICVDSETSLPAAYRLMKERGIRRLPVIDDGELVGIITLGDLRGALPSEVTSLNRFELDYLMHQVKVGRAMTRQVITIGPDDSVAEAAQRMLRHRIGGLPVVSPDGFVLGIVTESDIFRVLVQWTGARESGPAK